jgi:hypothetical protein
MGKETFTIPNIEQEEVNEDLQYKEELNGFSEEIGDYLITRKEIHRTFCEYSKEVLDTKDQQDVIDMFGWKDITSAINNFLKEKRVALKAAETKDTEHPDGDQTLLNNLNLTMLFLGNPNINGVLNSYYDDFVSIRSAKRWTERNTIKTNLAHKYNLSNKTDEEKRQYIATQRESFAKTDPAKTNGIDNTSTSNKPAVDKYNVYTEEEKAIKEGKVLPRSVAKIQSTGFERDPNTKTTLCSRTWQRTAKEVFHLNVQWGGSAWVAMRKSPEWGCKKTIVSDIFKKKEGNDAGWSVHDNDALGKSEYITQQAGGSNFADIFVTSSTRKWKLYWHRACMFLAGSQRYVLDPYTAMTKWTATNNPIPLEYYKDMMDHGTNHREFMRMNFYNSPVKIDGGATDKTWSVTPNKSQSNPTESELSEKMWSLYDRLENKEWLSERAFNTAYAAFTKAKELGKIKKQDMMTVTDYSKPNTEERLFVIDLNSNKVILKSQAWHGTGSGSGSRTEVFSNTHSSNKSSIGGFVTAPNTERNSKNTWTGVRLTGVEKGINDQADERGIFVHYRKNIYGGSGCMTIPDKTKAEKLNDILIWWSFVYGYTDQERYLANSSLLTWSLAA